MPFFTPDKNKVLGGIGTLPKEYIEVVESEFDDEDQPISISDFIIICVIFFIAFKITEFIYIRLGNIIPYQFKKSLDKTLDNNFILKFMFFVLFLSFWFIVFLSIGGIVQFLINLKWIK